MTDTDPSSNLRSIHTDLINIAAQMVRGEGVPDWSDHKFYRTTSNAERRDIMQALREADEALRNYAVRLKGIADKVSAEMKPVETSDDDTYKRGFKDGFEAAQVARLVQPASLSDERCLRRMLAFAYSGPGELYGDDGELQNGAELPIIDFNRDSVSDIERKITDRGRRRLAKMQQEEPSEQCVHNLIDCVSTLTVIDPYKAKCRVCDNFFDLPLAPEKASESTDSKRD